MRKKINKLKNKSNKDKELTDNIKKLIKNTGGKKLIKRIKNKKSLTGIEFSKI